VPASSVFVLFLYFLSGIALAQNTYPTRPITIIVPFAPGGNLDVTTRIVGAELSKILGQPIAVDNKAGAGGAIGHQLSAAANPGWLYAAHNRERQLYRDTKTSKR